MTILVSDLGDTAIGGFKRKVLEYGGLAFLGKGRGWGVDWFAQRKEGLQRRLSTAGAVLHRPSISSHRADCAQEDGLGEKRKGNLDEDSEEFELKRLPQTID